MEQRLKGKTALVTGGGRGFGRSAVLRMAREGADGAGAYRSGRESAEDVVAAVKELGGRSFAIQADVAHEDEIRAAVRAAAEQFGRLDILVNNAGIRHIAPFHEQDPEAWRDTLGVNVWGPMVGTHEAIPIMIEQGGGSIVSIASQMAHVGWANFAVYAATKAYLLEWTRCVAVEVGQYNIRANAVCPGSIVTDMNRANTPPEKAAEMASRVPLRRLGDPDDIGAAVAYLASDDATFVTGQCVDVNGGLVTV